MKTKLFMYPVLIWLLSVIFVPVSDALTGDISGDGKVNLRDALLSLKITSDLSDDVTIDGDVNVDKRIGLEEAIYALRFTAGLYPSIGPDVHHVALRSADSCASAADDIKVQAIQEMEKILDQNLKTALQFPYGCRPNYYSSDEGYGAVPFSAPMPTSAGGTTSSTSGATQYSETNVQVQGVDEADFIKNDGKYIYILANGSFRIIAVWPPEASETISSFQIEGIPRKIFVYNDRALIYSSLDYINQSYSGYYSSGYTEDTYGYEGGFTGDGRKSKISILDISDKSAPKLIRELFFSGSYLNSRRIDNAVHSVLVFPEPVFEGIKYWPDEYQYCGYYYSFYLKNDALPQYDLLSIKLWFETLRQKNTQIIQNTDLSKWLPSIKDVRHSEQGKLVEERLLGNCYLSEQKTGKNFMSVVSTDIDGKGSVQSVSIAGRPGAVYASESAIYIVSQQLRNYVPLWFFMTEDEIDEASTVHKFALKTDPPSAAYNASGVVKGRVLNQFSMDEYDGYFRIATTTGHWTAQHSTLSVFNDTDNTLNLIGQIDRIAPTEDIRSARFDGNRGFVVTFKKTDPLFVFDLSEPALPQIAGELKIPGFSTYIHRMDENRLLTIGYDAEDQGSFGWFQGIMLQVFDVADMKNPKLIHKEVIGTRGTSSDAAANHLAFNFFRPKNLLAIPMAICTGSSGGGTYGDTMTFNGLMIYRVTAEDGFKYLGGVSHADKDALNKPYACYNWWTQSDSMVKRSVFMDDYVFSVTDKEIRADRIDNLGTDVSVISLSK